MALIEKQRVPGSRPAREQKDISNCADTHSQLGTCGQAQGKHGCGKWGYRLRALGVGSDLPFPQRLGATSDALIMGWWRPTGAERQVLVWEFPFLDLSCTRVCKDFSYSSTKLTDLRFYMHCVMV